VSDAGTPAIADPGAALVRQARLLAFKVVPIPGPSALAAALSVAGLPDEEFAFMGFPPVRSKARNKWLSRLAERHQSMTVVCFEAPHRLLKTLSDLDFFVKSPIILLRELTKWHEQVLEGLPGELAARLHDPRGEFTLVIPAGTPAEPIVAVEQSTVTDDEIRSVFGRTAETEPRNTRRALVRHVAEVLGVPVRRVYDTTKGL
jgi:16S rRNA (cytidine1402-2'-O)-methyltransferase